MSKQVDLTGKTFGYLKVKNLKEVKHTHAFWNCECTYCGKDTVVRGTDLNTGKSTRCLGCYSRRFNKEESLEIARRVNDGDTKVSIAEDLDCSYKAIYSALKLIIELQNLKEKRC